MVRVPVSLLLPMVCSSGSTAAFAQGVPGQTCEIFDACLQTPNGPKCIGQWEPPRDLCFPGMCSPRPVCGLPPCTTAGCTNGDSGGDEIGHVALIPRNDALKGSVLFWTRCDHTAGYVSHVYNPLTNVFDPTHPPFVGAEEPFCAGHVWVLDENKNPKLLTAGGYDGATSGSERV